MEAIDVLGGVNGVHDLRAVETLWQWQLQQDAVDSVIVVQRLDERQQFLARSARREVVRERGDAALVAGLALVAHIDRGSRVFTHLHHREPGCATVLRNEVGGSRRRLRSLCSCDGLSVEDLCRHDCLSSGNGRFYTGRSWK